MVDPALSQIERGDHVVRLEQRSIAVLECLARRTGELVEKAEILAEVWPETFVTDEVLTHAVWELRKAFGDDAKEPRFIRTIPKKGYCLIATVDRRERPPQRPVQVESFASIEVTGETSGPVMAAPRPRLRIRSLTTVAVTLIAGVVYFEASSVDRRKAPAPVVAPAQEKRILVLPFGAPNGGQDAGLAEGITEDLTRLLGSLEGVETLGRKFATEYSNRKAKEIRDELGVDYLLEGRVRQSTDGSNRRVVHISAELVRLPDGTQVWARGFDSKLEDFQVLAEVGRSIVGELEVTLGLASSVVKANRAYLKGVALKAEPTYQRDEMIQAIGLFKLAVKEDSELVAGWAELAKAQAQIYFNDDRSEHWLIAAEQALKKAIHLAPDAREVQLAKAYVAFHGHRDFDEAQRLFEAVVDTYPNDSEGLRGLGYVERRLGLLEEACAHLEKAARLKPSAELSGFIAETYRARRLWELASQHYQAAADQDPEAFDIYGELAMNLFDLRGSAREARDFLARFVHDRPAEMLYYWLPLDLYAGSYYDAIDRYSHWPESSLPIDRIRNPWLVAQAARLLGQEDRARHLVENNRDFLLECVDRTPDDKYCRAYLGLALAFLGDAKGARTQMDVAMRIAAGDNFTGPRIRELLAEMEILLGRPAAAAEHIKVLLRSQYQHPISLARLHHDPAWAALRADPELAASITSGLVQ